MRPSSLRALLLAFVMVLQAVAGGFGAARAAPSGFDPQISAHCGQSHASETGSGNTGRDAHHHMCESCLLCAGPPSLPVGAFYLVPAQPRIFHSARFVAADSAGAPARLARGRLARGPPAIFPSA
ncbi:DUF2946 family protein [Methylocystis sp. JR02]|uniref:DUF2946 family protein n=1 Tax=Methylocystis sp. JR02 TaxID=3046284 RepID=UPI0024BB3DE1|nr:DUF2946 family protein [Methylocystis sp. JR02]MDJ0448609.1 hypothetical protein [Methylocystis sp. JR02]